jgi:uncharacterized phage infection (PIP) family protein YhgE
MQLLPDFMRRMLGFADKVEGHFSAADQLQKTQTQITELKEKLTQAEAKAAELSGQLEAASALNANLTNQVATLTADLTAQTTRANATIAAQGLDPALLPPLDVRPDNNPKESAWEKYERLYAIDPRAAAAHYMQNPQACLDSKPKPGQS